MRPEEIRLKEEILALNQRLRSSFASGIHWDPQEFIAFIEAQAGPLRDLRKLSKEELSAIGPVVGVDGSVNRSGGAYPHYVELYRGLALSTDGGREYVEEVYTPLLDKEEVTFGEPPDARKKKLAAVELDAARAYVEKGDLRILMMDGGLIRYRLEALEKWEALREACLSKGVILMGVIKDIKTDILGRTERTAGMYDREVLFGNLPYGKWVPIREEKNLKGEYGLASCFLRPSKGIQVIGIDLLKEQERHLEMLANLVFSLCPIDGRGVPLWLDITDREAKISHAYMEGMLEQFLDRDIYIRFFVSERDLR